MNLNSIIDSSILQKEEAIVIEDINCIITDQDSSTVATVITKCQVSSQKLRGLQFNRLMRGLPTSFRSHHLTHWLQVILPHSVF